MPSLVEAFGKSEKLKKNNNLILVLGCRDNISKLDSQQKDVFKEIFELIDKYNSIDKNILLNEFKIPEDRIDIVPIAAEIYLYFLNHIGAKTIENSFWSISDGLLKKVIKEEL